MMYRAVHFVRGLPAIHEDTPLPLGEEEIPWQVLYPKNSEETPF